MAKENRSLYCGDFHKVQTLIPRMNGTSTENRICQFIFDSLVVQEQDRRYTLSIAQEVDVSPDSLSYTFLLHTVRWQDGSLLTARDIQFTIEVLLNPQSVNFQPVLAAFIEDVTFVNPKTITITLTQPFYEPLALFTFKILPQHILRQSILSKQSPFAKNPVGCGPFKYVKGLGSNEVQLVRSEYFTYRKRPYFDKVFFRIYGSRTQAMQDLLRKKIHVIPSVYTQKSDKIAYEPNSQYNLHFLTFNYTRKHRYRELFSNANLRRALLQSLDRTKIVQRCFAVKKNNIISGPFPHQSWFYNKDIAGWDFDERDAKSSLQNIMSKKGFTQKKYWQKNGTPVELELSYTEENHREAVELIANHFEKAGFKTTVLLSSEQRDISYSYYTFSNTTDLIQLFSLYEMGKNSDIYQNSQLAELLHELHSTLNPWAIQGIGHQIHAFIHKETPFIFLWQLDSHVAYNKNLNIKLHPINSYRFPETWKFNK
ncbi:ABC transporter substrate-binding protein [Candidatus Uabimicrobium amorphum]|nr:ABC transporter substrate-binding protein [Candidatus Uabimicrobium amorphum]